MHILAFDIMAVKAARAGPWVGLDVEMGEWRRRIVLISLSLFASNWAGGRELGLLDSRQSALV